MRARDFLAKRVSLGWTDLDKTFASVIARCEPSTRVVYVGDGTPTTGDGRSGGVRESVEETV